jgi:hypothetical protein
VVFVDDVLLVSFFLFLTDEGLHHGCALHIAACSRAQRALSEAATAIINRRNGRSNTKLGRET